MRAPILAGVLCEERDRERRGKRRSPGRGVTAPAQPVRDGAGPNPEGAGPVPEAGASGENTADAPREDRDRIAQAG